MLHLCHEAGQPVTLQGGRTGLAGGATATAGEVVLSLARMHRILEVNEAARTLRCEAGATLESVQEAACARGLLYPVDFSSRGSAQIGGSVATNAGGVRVIRHGLTRDHVAGMTVVIATGDRLELGRGLVKDNTGYDLRQLFIGSEGTLGVIAEVVVKLVTPPHCPTPFSPPLEQAWIPSGERVARAILETLGLDRAAIDAALAAA